MYRYILEEGGGMAYLVVTVTAVENTRAAIS